VYKQQGLGCVRDFISVSCIKIVTTALAAMEVTTEMTTPTTTARIIVAAADNAEIDLGEHYETIMTSTLDSFEKEYKVTPLRVRLISEWNDKWGDSSERVSWYVYDWANSVYSSVCITLFIPLFMSSMVQRAAAGVNGELIQCNGSCSRSGCPSANLTANSGCQACIVGEGNLFWNGTSFSELPKLTVEFGGPVEAFSFTTRVLSFSVLAQALTFITFGAMADYGGFRKKGLIICIVLGSSASVCFIFLGNPSNYLVAPLCVFWCV
jgi:hypothetical protein